MLYRNVHILHIQYICTLQVCMSTTGIVIHFIGGGCQSCNSQEIHCFKQEFCVQFVQCFSEMQTWHKTGPTFNTLRHSSKHCIRRKTHSYTNKCFLCHYKTMTHCLQTFRRVFQPYSTRTLVYLVYVLGHTVAGIAGLAAMPTCLQLSTHILF